jgi:hypothetical protein
VCTEEHGRCEIVSLDGIPWEIFLDFFFSLFCACGFSCGGGGDVAAWLSHNVAAGCTGELGEICTPN